MAKAWPCRRNECKQLPPHLTDAHVWLQARTLSAPLVCYTQQPGVVLSWRVPYATVLVGGREYRIHEDNLRRSPPPAERVSHRHHAKPLDLPASMKEQTLWDEDQ